MQLKNGLTFFFSKWWRPLIAVVIGFLLFVTSILTRSRFYEELCSYFFGFTLLMLLISFVYQLIRKEKNAAMYTALSFIGLLMAFLYGIFFIMLETISYGDPYADGLSIPKNIEINEPKDISLHQTVRPDSILNIKRIKRDFELYHSFQPGLYRYDLWLGKTPRGTVYLKAYEITQNDALSTDQLPERTSMKVYNPTDSLVLFSLTHDFTIYEGDWGKPYAARFEVWFQPDSGEKEIMLFQKNYKIEGWMR